MTSAKEKKKKIYFGGASSVGYKDSRDVRRKCSQEHTNEI